MTGPGGLTIRGELAGAESVDLHGTLEGPLTTEGFCRIHEGGIVAQGEVELGARARVKPDIRARAIAIAERCFFDGQIHMEGDVEHVRFQEKRKRG